eukprot:1112989-Alexandrium_andersonii.AAC.1
MSALTRTRGVCRGAARVAVFRGGSAPRVPIERRLAGRILGSHRRRQRTQCAAAGRYSVRSVRSPSRS